MRSYGTNPRRKVHVKGENKNRLRRNKIRSKRKLNVTYHIYQVHPELSPAFIRAAPDQNKQSTLYERLTDYSHWLCLSNVLATMARLPQASDSGVSNSLPALAAHNRIFPTSLPFPHGASGWGSQSRQSSYPMWYFMVWVLMLHCRPRILMILCKSIQPELRTQVIQEELKMAWACICILTIPFSSIQMGYTMTQPLVLTWLIPPKARDPVWMILR
jgi:hypothetical protein